MRMREKYTSEVVPKLKEKFGYTNPMQVPRIHKVSITIGVGDARENAAFMERAVEELTAVACQKPVIVKAKKSVSNFKLRAGQQNAVMVTLRNERMWAFLEKLFNIALPRVRDFRGLKRSAFDGRGNYNMGVREQLIFPEVNFEKVARVRGMNVAIVTSAETDKEAESLLEELGCPFRVQQ